MLSDERSCLVLAAALSKATLYLREHMCFVRKLCALYMCVFACACERHPRSAPLKRKASPQRSLRQLHPTTCVASDITRLAHHSLSFIFLFCLFVAFFVRILVDFFRPSLSLHVVVFWFPPPQTQLLLCELSCKRRSRRAGKRLSHTEHVLWRYSPDARWLRCEGSVNEQQIRTGGRQNNSYISAFLSSEHSSFWTGKIGQVSAELLERAPVFIFFKEGLKGIKGAGGG